MSSKQAKSSQQNYTFLFTDVEGSTRLWEANPEKMSASIAYHNQLLSGVIDSHQGRVFKTVGDGFCVVFGDANKALNAAIASQLALALASPDSLFRLKVRMGLHTGPAEPVRDDFLGTSLNRVARLMSAANGEQILLSAYVKEQLDKNSEHEFRDLGLHRFRDVKEAMHLFQVLIPNYRNNLAPIKSLSLRPSNLPAQLSSFVGRENEIEDICRRFRNPKLRLLTLLGPGGIGKTRLSLELAANLLDEYEDGVYFIALAPAIQKKDVIEAIAKTLRLEEHSAIPLLESLKAYLQDRQILLLLDNFEQVIESAPVMNELLVAAPHLKILVTSREELFIYGEQLYHLMPLGLPTDTLAHDTEALLRYTAVRLFLERVQAVHPDFQLNESNAVQVLEICRALDGLPLAIELAAVRLREMRIKDIHTQLSQRLDILNSGPRDLPVRQRTMRGAIEWSYRLLPQTEKEDFMRLSVFVGAFTAEAADKIADAHYLNRLKEKSLIKQIQVDDLVMFVYLDTLREFALEQAKAENLLAGLQQRHADYYLSLVETAEPHLTGSNQALWFKHLEREEYNIQAALEWYLSQEFHENVGRMLAVLWRFWSVYSRLSFGMQWFERLLTKQAELSLISQARVFYGLGRLALLQSRLSEARQSFQASLDLYDQLAQRQGQADASLSLGEIALRENATLNAEKHFQLSLALYQESHNHSGYARCLTQLGRLANSQGNLAAARSLFQESIEWNKTHGSHESLAIAINDLAELYRLQKEHLAAMELYQESLQLYRDLSFDVGIAVMLHNLGQVQRNLGALDAAKTSLMEALLLLQSLEEKQVIAECFAALGAIYLDRAEKNQAISLLASADALIQSLGIQLGDADQVTYLMALEKMKRSYPDYLAFWEKYQTKSLEQVMENILRDYPPA